MTFTNCKLFNIGDRFKVVGKLTSNIQNCYEGNSATIVKVIDSIKKQYEVLFDNGIRCQQWTDENDMKHTGTYPLRIGFLIRNKKDKSEWLIDKITAYYEFWGTCVKAGSEYHVNDAGGSSKLNDYEIISKTSTNTLMKKLSTMMKKLLDKDTQTLVKAGFINGDLDVTEEGQKALNSIMFIEKKAELVKLAEEILAEAEKDK